MTIIKKIRAWFRTQRLYRAYPELRAIDAKIGAAKRKHMPVRTLYLARQRLMTRALKDETQRWTGREFPAKKEIIR